VLLGGVGMVACTPGSGLAAGKLPPRYGRPSDSIRLSCLLTLRLLRPIPFTLSGFLDGCPKNRNGAKNIEIIRKQQYGVGKRTVFLYSSFYLRVGCIKEQVALTALVVYFLLGNSPACEVYMPTFRNTLFHLHR